MTKNILIINGHPFKNSFCESLAKEYAKGAKESKGTVKLLDLKSIKFNPILEKYDQKLESALQRAQKAITEAEHIVIVYPLWWGTMPALLKGFFDRVFIPGFAYNVIGRRQEKLLKGKTAHVIMTMGAPKIVYELTSLNRATHRIMKHGILGWVGIKPVRFSVFGSVPYSTEKKREKWLKHIWNLGFKQK